MSLESDSSEEADEEGIGSCLNEMHDLLLERISRVYEFDQVIYTAVWCLTERLLRGELM